MVLVKPKKRGDAHQKQGGTKGMSDGLCNFAKNKNFIIMTHIVRNSILRAVCLLILGTILLVFSDHIAGTIVQIIGVLLIVPGLFSLGNLLRKEKTPDQVALYLVLGISTISLGLVLFIWSDLFIKSLMYILAGLLILMAITQMASRWQMQKDGIKLDKLTFLIPVLTFAAGVFVIAFPMETASLPFCLIGAAFIIYALLEFTSVWQISKYRKAHPKASAVEVDEDTDEKKELPNQN